MAAGGVRGPPYAAVLTLIGVGTDDTVWPHLQADADRAGVRLLTMPLWRWCAWVYAHLTAGLNLKDRAAFDEQLLGPLSDEERAERWGLDDASVAGQAHAARLLGADEDDLSYLPEDVRLALAKERMELVGERIRAAGDRARAALDE